MISPASLRRKGAWRWFTWTPPPCPLAAETPASRPGSSGCRQNSTRRTRFARIYLNFEEATGRAGRERDQPLAASLPPGTFVDLDINGPVLPGTFELPDAADQLNGQVWIVADGKLAQRTPLMHGRRQGSFVVDAFDYGAGIVIGAVPAAREGLEVDTAEQDT